VLSNHDYIFKYAIPNVTMLFMQWKNRIAFVYWRLFKTGNTTYRVVGYPGTRLDYLTDSQC